MSSPASFPPGVDPRTVSDPEAVDPAAALRPAVVGAGAASGAWLVGGGSAALGLLAFLYLSSHRTAPARDLPPPSQAADAAVVAAPPPPPEVDAAEAAARGQLAARPAPALALVTPPPAPPPTPPVIAAPRAMIAAPPTAHAPVLVVDLAQPGDAAAAPSPAGGKAAAEAGAARAPTANLNTNEQFEQRVETGSEPERARATMLRDPSSTVAQGALIPAVLETALNSDLPGFARAVVSRDVRSFDGSEVLIPRGSRVVGEYRSAASQGQSRIFVIWTRVLRPDGGSIQISSGGGDELGHAGLAGRVDRHFLERFSGAVLLTVLNAAAYAAAGTPSTQVVIGSSGGSNGLTGAAAGLAPTDIPPTIKVAQGTPIRIFVQRDLDFTPVGGTP